MVLCIFTNPALAKTNTKATESINLPATYDLRDLNGKNYVTPPKNQGTFNTCWAHAAISCAETNSYLKSGVENDFSEKALAWFTYQPQGSVEADDEELEGVSGAIFDYSNMPVGFHMDTCTYNISGYARSAANQLSNWLGAGSEAQIPYCNSDHDYIDSVIGTIPDPRGYWDLDYYDIYENAFHLQNSEVITGSFTGQTVEEYVPKAKELMLDYGSLGLTYSMLQNGQGNDYFNDTTYGQYIPAGAPNMNPNHYVTTVGWDDNFSKENFKVTPPGDGAWIIKNSYGSDWGDEGYFYLSYYDSTITSLSSYDVESEDTGYSFDHNYQYDYLGDKGLMSYLQGCTGYVEDHWVNTLAQTENKVNSDKYSFANVFTAEGNENLDAVSAYTLYPNANVTAKIYLLNDGYTSPVDGQLVETVTENYKNVGFYTLVLDDPIVLEPGQKFSVVENITYPITYNNQTQQISAYSIEYGLKDQLFRDMYDNEGQVIGTVLLNMIALVDPGESYVYGLSNDPANPSNAWTDITNPETYEQLSWDTTFNMQGMEFDNTFVPGNCMIKAYTVENDPEAVMPTEIEFEDSSLYLSTDILGINSADTSAALTPSNATGGITYSVYPSNVVSVTQNGNVATVTAIAEGRTRLIAKSVNGYVATQDILVSNNNFIVGGVTVNNNQDTLGIEINNLRANPAITQPASATSVSVFVWSKDDMSDAKALPAVQIPNTNNWITSVVGINYTDNYLLEADQIKYVVCVGSTNHSLTDQVFSGFASWVSPGVAAQGNVSYISYNQNVGFVTPTVHEGSSGEINNPNSVHMEGLRVSSGIPGVNVITTVHAAELGWMDPVEDGVYAGTMHQNRALEAIQLNLDTTLDNYQINYRVYVAGQGWTNWVSDGATAGTTGQGLPIQAVEIEIVDTTQQ